MTSRSLTAPPPRPSNGSTEYGGKAAATPAEAAKGRDRVLLRGPRCRPARRDAWAQDGAFGAMNKGGLFVDHTTASATIARELAAQAKERGFGFRRCAGFRRPGGRGQRQAHHHVRRQRGRLCQGRAGDGALCRASRGGWVPRARASSPRWSTRSASPASCRAWPKASA